MDPLNPEPVRDLSHLPSQKERDNQQTRGESDEKKADEDSSRRNGTKKMEEIYQYAKSHQEHTTAYILLALGLLFLLFFNQLAGGLIIGMVAGYYFSMEIIYYLRHMGRLIGGQGQLRYVVFTTVLLGFFIAAPGIFIGAAIVAAFKQVFTEPL